MDRLIEPRKEQALTLRERIAQRLSGLDAKYIRRLEDENDALKQIITQQDKQINNFKLAHRESSTHRAKLLSANQVQARTIETLKDVLEQEEETFSPADPKEVREFETLLSLVDDRPEVSR